MHSTQHPSFECHGWSVCEDLTPEEGDYTWVVLDRDGDILTDCETRDEAIEVCRENGTEAYHELLAANIVDVLETGEVEGSVLEQIASLLKVSVS